MWIDTHCHFDAEEFEADREQVLVRAVQAGVEAIVVPGYAARHWERLFRVCGGSDLPRLYAAPGLHPCYIHEHQFEHLVQLAALLQSRSCIAIGEIGLDTYVTDLKDPDVYRKQQQYFTEQLRLAKDRDMPVILHVRKAHADVFRILKSVGFSGPGIVHAFSGGIEEARHYVRMGFRLGIGGSLTYGQAKRLHEVVRAMPLETLVIETDAPDMIPSSFRRGGGHCRNSPEYLPAVAEALAAVKGVSLARLAEQLKENSRDSLRLFH